jgi:hypothetical protein
MQVYRIYKVHLVDADKCSKFYEIQDSQRGVHEYVMDR